MTFFFFLWLPSDWRICTVTPKLFYYLVLGYLPRRIRDETEENEVESNEAVLKSIRGT